MSGWTAALLVGIILLDIVAVSSSRLHKLVRIFAVQAFLLGALALLLGGTGSYHAWIVAGGTIAIKGLAVPYFLKRALLRTGVLRELEPLVPFGASLVLTVLAVGLSFGLAGRLPEEAKREGLLLAATAFSTMFTGLLLLISRSKAISEVVGYLVLENGIFLFGMTLLDRQPLVVEMGILLDVFVGVFVMGILVYNIARAFDDVDVRALTSLTDEDEP